MLNTDLRRAIDPRRARTFDTTESRNEFLIGESVETRHLIVRNEQAVLPSPWSIHCGSGTASYGFIWAMSEDNVDYADMDIDAVAPGYVVSNNTEALGSDSDRSKAILERIPLRRWTESEDIAGTVTFRALPAGRYVTGRALPVYGGWLAR